MKSLNISVYKNTGLDSPKSKPVFLPDKFFLITNAKSPRPAAWEFHII